MDSYTDTYNPETSLAHISQATVEFSQIIRFASIIHMADEALSARFRRQDLELLRRYRVVMDCVAERQVLRHAVGIKDTEVHLAQDDQMSAAIFLLGILFVKRYSTDEASRVAVKDVVAQLMYDCFALFLHN